MERAHGVPDMRAAPSGQVAPSPLRVLFQDDLLLAIDKPAGALSVPGRGGAAGEVALSERVRELAPEALPVHRLDRGTSGLLLFGVGREAHRALCGAFEDRRAEKVYLALAQGDLAAAARCDLPLAPARRGGMRTARAGEPGAQAASTGLAPIERFGGATWLEARPRTGRTHQIRVHLAALGHPLLVDERYGGLGADERALRFGAASPVALLDRTPLHAAALRVPHPRGRGWLSLEAPLPEDLARCLEALRAGRSR